MYLSRLILSVAICCSSLCSLVSSLCNSPEDEMTFELTFYGDWSQMVFPKQYPIYRKNAQWSTILGSTHNEHYTMWAEDQVVTKAFKQFVEESYEPSLDSEMAASDDVLETFGAPQLMTGVGSTITMLRVTRDFTKVSFISHLIPSPDWFVGLSGYDLCEGSDWLRDPVTIDLQPFDAGTDQGFMFSSPDFPQDPPLPVTQITAQEPSHPANSFNYPHLDKLPRLAHVTITPVSPESKLKSADTGPPKPPAWLLNINSNLNGPAALEGNSIIATPLDCEVTDWGAWGMCDDKCKVGIQRRYRIVIQKPKNGGQECPDLLEMRICNERMARKRPGKKKCAKKIIKKEIKKYMKKQMKNFNPTGIRKYII